MILEDSHPFASFAASRLTGAASRTKESYSQEKIVRCTTRRPLAQQTTAAAISSQEGYKKTIFMKFRIKTT